MNRAVRIGVLPDVTVASDVVQAQGTDQVTVHQTVDGEPRNAIIRVIFAIISPLFMNRLANRQIAGDLQKLKHVVEAG